MVSESLPSFLVPVWPAPERVKALTTTRGGGCSAPPYESFNMGDHVGDVPTCVGHNRRRLTELAGLPESPRWMNQVHGTRVSVESGILCSDSDSNSIVVPNQDESGCEADASITDQAGIVLAVMTADCLPVLVCDRQGERIGAIHAGWRGLLDGIIEQTFLGLSEQIAREGGGTAPKPDDWLVWLGPAIGPEAFEVGDEVRQAFLAHDPAAEVAFRPPPPAPHRPHAQTSQSKWLADLYLLARQRLQGLGIEAIYGGGFCTYTDSQRFFSYRRDGVTGRMATCIWLDESGSRADTAVS